jgi:hypothetical protein
VANVTRSRAHDIVLRDDRGWPEGQRRVALDRPRGRPGSAARPTTGPQGATYVAGDAPIPITEGSNMSSRRLAPLSGIAFAVFFLASVVASSVPKNTASDAKWVAAYATHGKQAGHLATGILLVLAGLSLMTFLTYLWRQVIATGGSDDLSPLPVVAAGVSAACIAAGGVLMAAPSGAALAFSQPIPGAELLRFANDVGFGMVGLGGMFAAAFSIACLSVQARTAGLFSPRLARLSQLVALVLLASIAFVPIVALVIWLVLVAVKLMRLTPRQPARPLSRAAS